MFDSTDTERLRKPFVKTLNQVFSSRSARRRYEAWFLRLGLTDRSGAWWFRYLLINPGRSGCAGNSQGQPVQVWATWFPQQEKPRSFIQGFPLDGLQFSTKGQVPFHFQIGDNAIEEDSCRGRLKVEGHEISWNLRYSSSFAVTLSDKGWIGFSRTPHSDAVFAGEITLDGRTFTGEPLGFGVQGHNCGYRHRNFWRWAHIYLLRLGRSTSTFEVLVYEMPLGLVFRKAVLWHEGKPYLFRNLQEISRDRQNLRWNFRASNRNGANIEVTLDGAGFGMHRLAYLKTDCSSTFEVANNSLAKATLRFEPSHGRVEVLETVAGAVVEMAG